MVAKHFFVNYISVYELVPAPIQDQCRNTERYYKTKLSIDFPVRFCEFIRGGILAMSL